MQKNEQSLRNLWDTIERNDIYIYTESPRRRNKKRAYLKKK